MPVQLRDQVAAWQHQHNGREVLTVGITGNPACVAETGSGLLRDGRGTAIGILGLFWLAHRR